MFYMIKMTASINWQPLPCNLGSLRSGFPAHWLPQDKIAPICVDIWENKQHYVNSLESMSLLNEFSSCTALFNSP